MATRSSARSTNRSPSPARRRVARSPSPVAPVAVRARVHDVEFEGPHSFGGVFGATALILFLPAVILSLKIFCEKDFCFETLDFAAASRAIPRNVSDYLTWEATAVYFGWVAYMAACERFLPAKIADGQPLRDGSRLAYRLNGHLSLWVTVLLLDHWNEFGFVRASLSWVYDNYLRLAVISTLSAAALSVYLYITSFVPGKMLALGGNTGYPTYDFWMGRELNPRIGNSTFDIKLFVEMRLGLIGWVVLDLAMLATQYERALVASAGTSAGLWDVLSAHASPEMLLVVGFQYYYILDSLYNEHRLLTTLDITTEGLGYMLTFGDMVWIPFGFSVQARYLVEHNPQLPTLALWGIVALYVAGYMVFRLSNSQKDLFRTNPTDPQVAHLQTMKTKRGTSLLTSGFWGAARKINYTGDLMIALAFCLPCGFSTPIPYFYFVYLLSLLIHRAYRDDLACAAKYGDDWVEYKKIVPYVFIPYVI